MYSTKTASFDNTEFNSYMEVGINEDTNLQSIEVLKSPQGRDYLKITFEKDGKTASFTEWKNEKNMWIKTDEDLQKRDNQQFGRLLQLINCFYETTPEFEANSFSEMINWVKVKLDEKKTTKKLRVKVVYDKNGYTTISKLGYFVEPMTIEKEKSQIKLFKNDLMERVVADKETSKDPMATTVTSSESKDDLPF